MASGPGDGTRDAAEQSKALDSITDRVEEKELDEEKLKREYRKIAEQDRKEQEEKRKREKELAKVKVNKEDVQAIVREMEVDSDVAERRLKEHNGDVVAALMSYLTALPGEGAQAGR